jgi:ATP-dependent protease ClpP protease subunit
MESLLEIRKGLNFSARVVGDQVFMLLDKGIGPSMTDATQPYIDGSKFAEEMYYWKSQGKNVCVKINSPGGRVTHGWSMIDAIIETGADTVNAGVAYSMAAVCLLFGKKRKAYNYASTMLHAPHGGSPEYLPIVTAQFKELLESRTKFTKDEITEIMSSGKDHKYNAKQMLEKGIIDEIIETGNSMRVPEYASTEELHDIFNSSLITEFKTKPTMENILARLLGKKTDEEAVVAAVEMKTKNDVLEATNAANVAQLEALNAKIAHLEAVTKAGDIKIKAAALIEGAITVGKFPSLPQESKDKLIESAVANYDGTKLMIDAIPAQTITRKAVAAVAQIVAEGKGAKEKSYKWLAQNDPKGLEAIAETDPELFGRLQDEYNAEARAAQK